MNNKLGQEPAFAALVIDKSIKVDGQTTEHFISGNNGMSKRFYAACAAMQGMLTNMQFLKVNGETAINNGLKPDEFLVKTAYSLADELLKQENNE